ncbi:hypothetical protein [Enterobacter hormaechei]|uniref:hypothetical protein n=1 Tax=Enterobacter hormaechei TaxID=158836 RepID=UPI0015D4B6C4|nr:hypothetical protein [Enterobacter hormaechei]
MADDGYVLTPIHRGESTYNRKINQMLTDGNYLLLIGEPAKIRDLLGQVYLQHQLQLEAPIYGRDGRIQIPDGVVYSTLRLYFIDDAVRYNPFHLVLFIRLAKRFNHRVVLSVYEIDDITDELQELLVVVCSVANLTPLHEGFRHRHSIQLLYLPYKGLILKIITVIV